MWRRDTGSFLRDCCLLVVTTVLAALVAVAGGISPGEGEAG